MKIVGEGNVTLNCSRCFGQRTVACQECGRSGKCRDCRGTGEASSANFPRPQSFVPPSRNSKPQLGAGQFNPPSGNKAPPIAEQDRALEVVNYSTEQNVHVRIDGQKHSVEPQRRLLSQQLGIKFEVRIGDEWKPLKVKDAAKVRLVEFQESENNGWNYAAWDEAYLQRLSFAAGSVSPAARTALNSAIKHSRQGECSAEIADTLIKGSAQGFMASVGKHPQQIMESRAASLYLAISGADVARRLKEDVDSSPANREMAKTLLARAEAITGLAAEGAEVHR